MDISNLINSKNVNLSLSARTKDEVINQLVEMMVSNGVVSSFDQFKEDVLLREEIGVTGMGNAIAIPHGESTAVNFAGIAVGRTKEFIEWESLDDEPSRLFFLLAVPKGDKEKSHIKMLSQLASILAYEEIQNDLMSSKDENEFITKFNQYYKEYLEKNR